MAVKSSNQCAGIVHIKILVNARKLKIVPQKSHLKVTGGL